MHRFDSEVSPEPQSHRRRELGINPEPGHEAGVVRSLAAQRGHRRLGRDHRVIELMSRVQEARSDVFRLEIRILGEDVLGGLPRGE